MHILMVPDDGAYGDYLIGRGLAPRTVRAYEQKMATAIVWFSDRGLDIDEASARDVFMFASELAESHATRVQLRCALKHWWTYREIPDPPLGAVQVPTAPPMVSRALTPDEADRLVQTALGWYPHGLATLFGMAMAMRREEIAAAQWSRFSPDGDWYTVLGKGLRTRTLPVHPLLSEEVHANRRIDRTWIFPGRNPTRGHVTPATVWDWTRQVAVKAGVERFATHRMRHTALAEMNDRLKDLRTTQDFAGHASPEQTAGYTRTTAARLRDASNSLPYMRRRRSA
jgi:integrase